MRITSYNCRVCYFMIVESVSGSSYKFIFILYQQMKKISLKIKQQDRSHEDTSNYSKIREKNQRRYNFFYPSQLKKKKGKETQTEEESPMRLSKTWLLRSFQIAHMRACKHNIHSFLGNLPEWIELQEVRRSSILAGTAKDRLTSQKSLLHNLQLKEQCKNKWAFDSAA